MPATEKALIGATVPWDFLGGSGFRPKAPETEAHSPKTQNLRAQKATGAPLKAAPVGAVAEDEAPHDCKAAEGLGFT